MSDFLAPLQPGCKSCRPTSPGKPVDELARELGIDPAAIVKLASNENPLGASPKALEAIRAELAELTRYPDGNGFELKRKLAERCAVDAAQVTLGNGSNDILDLVCSCLPRAWSERRVQRTCLRRLPDRHPGRGRRGAGGHARAWGMTWKRCSPPSMGKLAWCSSPTRTTRPGPGSVRTPWSGSSPRCRRRCWWCWTRPISNTPRATSRPMA